MNDELLIQIDVLEKEKRELELQLARCIVELKNAGCWLDSLNNLPKTTHLDAEILRCAETLFTVLDNEYAEIDDKDLAHDNLGEAVRSKMETVNDL